MWLDENYRPQVPNRGLLAFSPEVHHGTWSNCSSLTLFSVDGRHGAGTSSVFWNKEGRRNKSVMGPIYFLFSLKHSLPDQWPRSELMLKT